MEAQVTAQSQTYRLQQRAQEAKIRHGQEVRADIPNVRVAPAVAMADAIEASAAEPTPSRGSRFRWLRPEAPVEAKASGTLPRGDVFFCNIGSMRIREVLTDGDDAPMPSTVVLEGMVVPKAGSYDLVNVLVRTNGDLRIVVDEQTRVEPTRVPWFGSAL